LDILSKARPVKPPIGLLVAVQIAFGLIACGGTGGTGPRSQAPSSTTESSGATAGTTPAKGAGHARFEESRSAILYFGHPASPADKQAVTRLVMRYYAAAAREDGATACSLLLSSLANSVPEDYGQAPGPPSLRGGKTCQAVMTKLFKLLHRKLAAEDAGLEVTRVRLKAKGGYAVMRFKTTPELHETNVVREGSGWKISSLLDSGVGR
jgi:hypothetical protein